MGKKVDIPVYEQIVKLEVKRFQLTTLRSLVYREIARRRQELTEKKIVPDLVDTAEDLIKELVELEKDLAEKMATL